MAEDASFGSPGYRSVSPQTHTPLRTILDGARGTGSPRTRLSKRRINFADVDLEESRRSLGASGGTWDPKRPRLVRRPRKPDNPPESAGPRQKERTGIKIATYNIRSGRGGNLEAALRALAAMRIDVGVLVETKLTDDAYTKYSSGYQVIATKAASPHQGGVALVHRQTPYCQVESERCYGPNVISCVLVSGSTRTHLIGAYIPPGDVETLGYIQKAERNHPQLPIVLLGDLNTDLRGVRDGRAAEIAAMVSSLGLEDMSLHFRQRKSFRSRITWHMQRQDMEICSRCDYILGSDRRLFSNVSIRDPRYYASDHYMVCGTMLSAPLSENRAYLKGRRQFPLSLTTDNQLESSANTLFTEIKATLIPPPRRERRDGSWISEDTWRLIDTRASLHRAGRLSTSERRRLNRRIRRSLGIDRKRRVETAGTAIETCLRAGQLQEAWNILSAWYKNASGRAPRPSRQELDRVATEYEALYRSAPSPGEPVPLLVSPFQIPDDEPSEEEITEAVRRLKRGKAPGPSGMTADHLKEIEQQAHREINPDRSTWDKLVQLVRLMFRTGEVPTELSWSILVLIPKGNNGEFRGIGLLEVVWKLVSSIIDKRLKTTISFHEALHGFRSQRGTGTATLEAKLQMQLAHLQRETLFQIFLDLSKAYDTLDRERTLEILEGYGVGPNTVRLLRTFWSKQLAVARQSGYHSRAFIVARGVTQGDVVSPTIFNVVVDAIVRHWFQTTQNESIDTASLAVQARFYADDGLIASRDHEHLQRGLDLFVELFQRMGLKANATKTKAMICSSGTICTRISTPAYNPYKRRVTGHGDTYSARKRRCLTCTICESTIQARHLNTHMRNRHGIYPDPAEAVRNAASNMDRIPISRFEVSVPLYTSRVLCPVAGCNSSHGGRYALRRHFMFKHPLDSIIILEEGELPRCEHCDMFVTPTGLTSGHHESQLCQQGKELKRKRRLEMEARRAREVVFTLAGNHLETVDTFLYLGRPVTSNDDDWPALDYNLAKARSRWQRVARMLAREGASTKTSGMFYKAIVMSVLLFSAETWVVTSSMLRVLESFHHSVARSITRRYPRFFHQEGRWQHPSSTETLEAAGLFPLTRYLEHRREYLVEFGASLPILNKCRSVKRDQFSARKLFWWDR